MKVIIQVIATEADTQVTTIRNTWASKLHPDCRVEFVYGKGRNSYGLGKNVVYAPFLETRENIGRKTIYAIGESLKKCETEPFDYIFRTNVSSYVDSFLLMDYLQKFTEPIWYGGVTVFDPDSQVSFLSGCGFLLSKECCQLICDNYFDLHFDLIDDVMIGKFLAERGVPRTGLPRVDIGSCCNGILIPDHYLTEHQLPRVFHYRVKNEGDRNKDLSRLKTIHYVRRQDRRKNRIPPTVQQWMEYCEFTRLSTEITSRQRQVNVLIHGNSVNETLEAALSLDCRIRLYRDVKLAEGMDLVVGKPYLPTRGVASGHAAQRATLATFGEPLATLGLAFPALPYFDLPQQYRVGLASDLYRAAYATMPKICLSMIVKNEAKCILKCLGSVVDFIDHWIISDTGSSDDTCFYIQKFFDTHRIPGQLLHDRRFESRPFHFGDARNLPLFTACALEHCKYTLTLDADEELSCPSYMNLKRLLRANSEIESFNLMCKINNTEFQRTLIINPHLGFKYTGAVHESVFVDGATCENRPNLNLLIPSHYGMILCKNAGARSENPDKFLADAQNIESDMVLNGYNDRSQFYMAQCLSDHVATLKHRVTLNPDLAKTLKPAIVQYRTQALEAFQLRVDRGDAVKEKLTPTEYYKALISIARLRAEEFYDHRCAETFQLVYGAFRAAIAFDENRPDALFELSLFLEPLPQWNNLAFELVRTAYEKRDLKFEEYLFIEQHIRNDAAIFYAKMLKDRGDELWKKIVAQVRADKTASDVQLKRCDRLSEG